jgi:hypothetical protein
VALAGFAVSEGESLKDVHGPYIGLYALAVGTDAHEFVALGQHRGTEPPRTAGAGRAGLGSCRGGSSGRSYRASASP